MIKHNQNKVLQFFFFYFQHRDSLKKKKNQQGGGAGLSPEPSQLPTWFLAGIRTSGREREAGSAASWPVYERSLGSSGGLLQTLSGGLGWAAGLLAGQPMGPAATPRWFPGGLRNSSRDGDGSGLQGWVLTLSRRKAGLPMAGLWPCGQSLSQGGDPARVQGVGRPLRRCSSHPGLQARGLRWGVELLTSS